MLACDDHRIPHEKLLAKYHIPPLRKKTYATIDQNFARNDSSRGKNVVFSKQDHTIIYLIYQTLIDPVNILSFGCAATLVVIYFFNNEEKKHLLVFLFTFAIMIIKTAFEVFEETRINRIYKQHLDSYGCRIVFGSQSITVGKEFLRVGDVLDLRKGDTVGADAVLVNSNNILIERAIGNRKHKGLKKTHTRYKEEFDESPNVVLGYDKIIQGRAKAIVVRIGADTKVAQVYKGLICKKELHSLLYSKMLVFFFVSLIFAISLSLVMILIGMLTGITFFNAIDLLVSVIIALIPEGVPLTIKFLLFSAISKLQKKGIMIRHANTIEKLGLTTHIIAEKNALVPRDGVVCSYIYDGDSLIDVELAFIDSVEDSLTFLRKIAYITGLVSFSKRSSYDRSYYAPLKVLSEICNRYFVGFTRMSTKIKDIRSKDLDGIIADEGDFKSLYVTGPVESVLNLCRNMNVGNKKVKLSHQKKLSMLKLQQKMKKEGHYSIGFAFKSFGKEKERYKMKGLTFICIYFIQEAPDLSIPLATNLFKCAKINFAITTNTQAEDQLNSSRSIVGFEEKLVSGETALKIKEPTVGRILASAEYNSLTKEEKDVFFDNERFIIYRCDSTDKANVVTDLQEKSKIVCFVGSEITDSKALSSADIGICFEDSNRLCREASSVILQAQKFDDIIYSLEEGRLFFVNLQKSIRYILMHITPQLFPFFLYVAFGSPVPLSPILLIFLNYIVEVIPAVLLSLEKPEYNLITEPQNMIKSALKIANTATDLDTNLFSTGLMNFIISFKNIVNKGLIYKFPGLSWSILEAGLLSTIGCEISFYSVLHVNKIPVSKMFFSANKYFIHNAPSFTLTDGTKADYNIQLDILFKGQSTYFLGLLICQFANILVCRREREYFFSRFFNNIQVVLYTLLGVMISVSIVYIKFFEEFLLIRRPNTQALLYPTISAVLIIMFDTVRKYKKMNKMF
ncbi:hypothetical protein GINT2_000395 [Glugoides intestinalis]